MPDAGRPVRSRLNSCERCAAASASLSLPAQSASVGRVMLGDVQRKRLTNAHGQRVNLGELALGRAQVAQGDQAGHAPLHRLGLDVGLTELFGELAGLGQHRQGPVQAALRARPIRAHEHGGQPEAVIETARHGDRVAFGDRALLVVADEGERSAAPGQQLDPQLRVVVVERRGGLLEQLDRALVGDARTPAGLLEADRSRRQQLGVVDLPGDLRGRPEGRHRLVGAPAAKAGGSQLHVDLGPAPRILDAEFERRDEAHLGPVEIQAAQRRPARPDGVRDRPLRAVDRRRRSEVIGEIGHPTVAAALRRPFQGLADLEVELGAAQGAHAVIQRAAHQLMGEPEAQPARRDLLDHPVGDRLAEGRLQLGVGQAGGRDGGQIELVPDDRRDLQQAARGRREVTQALGDDLADAVGAAELGQRVGQLPATVVGAGRVGVEHRAPQLGDQEGVAAGQLMQDAPHLVRVGSELVAAGALDELRDLVGAQAAQAQPRHPIGATQLDERRRERLGDLGLGVAERRHDQRAGVNSARARGAGAAGASGCPPSGRPRSRSPAGPGVRRRRADRRPRCAGDGARYPDRRRRAATAR